MVVYDSGPGLHDCRGPTVTVGSGATGSVEFLAAEVTLTASLITAAAGFPVTMFSC